MSAITSFQSFAGNPSKDSTKEKQTEGELFLQKNHEIVVPNGIRYEKFNKGFWPALQELEERLYPFGVVKARQTVSLGCFLIDMIVVDLKTFHCTLQWSGPLPTDTSDITAEMWVSKVIGEIINGYKRYYNLYEVPKKYRD